MIENLPCDNGPCSVFKKLADTAWDVLEWVISFVFTWNKIFRHLEWINIEIYKVLYFLMY